MSNLSFRDYLIVRDISESKLYLQKGLKSETFLVSAINDLLFVSASISLKDEKIIHPIIFMNAIKNIIGDDRETPSKVLLEFSIEYLMDYEFRENDQRYLNEYLADNIPSTVFIGDLEDACQNRDWGKANSLAAQIFIASDNSRGVLDTMVELALQNSDRNALFVYHLLRAYNFQGKKEDNWTYTKCILEYLDGSILPNPHCFSEKTPVNVKNKMITSGNLPLFSAIERLWDGDYPRIRGYRRELSHWSTQFVGSDSDPIDGNFNHWILSGEYGRKFIDLAEGIVENNKAKPEKVKELVTLESIRALFNNASKEQLAMLGARMDQLLYYGYR